MHATCPPPPRPIYVCITAAGSPLWDYLLLKMTFQFFKFCAFCAQRESCNVGIPLPEKKLEDDGVRGFKQQGRLTDGLGGTTACVTCPSVWHNSVVDR